MTKNYLLLRLLPFLSALIVSCNIGEPPAIDDMQQEKGIIDNLKGEAGVIRAIEDFISSVKSDPATRSGVNTSIGSIVKKSVFDYYLTSGTDVIIKLQAAQLCKAIAEDSKATQWYPGEAEQETQAR